MIDQLLAASLLGAAACGMTREEIETEFKIDCAELDARDFDKLTRIGKLIQHTRALDAAILVDKLLVHIKDRAEAITLAAAILSKKA